MALAGKPLLLDALPQTIGVKPDLFCIVEPTQERIGRLAAKVHRDIGDGILPGLVTTIGRRRVLAVDNGGILPIDLAIAILIASHHQFCLRRRTGFRRNLAPGPFPGRNRLRQARRILRIRTDNHPQILIHRVAVHAGGNLFLADEGIGGTAIAVLVLVLVLIAVLEFGNLAENIMILGLLRSIAGGGEITQGNLVGPRPGQHEQSGDLDGPDDKGAGFTDVGDGEGQGIRRNGNPGRHRHGQFLETQLVLGRIRGDLEQPDFRGEFLVIEEENRFPGDRQGHGIAGQRIRQQPGKTRVEINREISRRQGFGNHHAGKHCQAGQQQGFGHRGFSCKYLAGEIEGQTTSRPLTKEAWPWFRKPAAIRPTQIRFTTVSSSPIPMESEYCCQNYPRNTRWSRERSSR